jgi:GNAT superfamily N-acetyltransferase
VQQGGGWRLRTGEGDSGFALSAREVDRMFGDAGRGEQIYRRLVAQHGTEEGANAALRAAGLRGIENNVERGARNFVLFPGEENALRILDRNGQRLPGLLDVDTLRTAHPDIDFDLRPTSGGYLSLDKVVVPKAERGQGKGSAFMESLTQAADAQGVPLALTPATDFGATSKARLTDFYRRFGFVPNKGRNVDHSIMAAMRRPPSGSSR